MVVAATATCHGAPSAPDGVLLAPVLDGVERVGEVAGGVRRGDSGIASVIRGELGYAERCGSIATGTAMALPDRSRSLLATIIGWVLAAIVVWLALRLILGTVGFVVRGLVVIVVIAALLWAYLALKVPDD